MNTAAARPFAAFGVALMGAGVIAATPVAVPAAPAIPHLNAPAIALQASIIDLFTFPILRQIAANQVEVIAIEAQGLAEAGQGATQSVLKLPSALITATRQTLTGNPLDGLTTLETWAVDSAKATVVPVITANINVGQIDLAIQSALLPAEPLALVSAASGLFNGADLIARGLITAGQDLVRAVLSFNIQKIVQAVVGGVQTVVTSIGAGVQSAVDGVVGAQTLIADALKARPVAPTASVKAPRIAAALASTKAAPKAAAAVDATVADAPAAKTGQTHSSTHRPGSVGAPKPAASRRGAK